MKNIHFSTIIGSVLNIAAVVILFIDLHLVAGVMAVLAYFCAMKEVSKYTSWFQFTNVWLASILVGLSIDTGENHFPFFAFTLFLSGFGAIFRIVNFRVFGYTGQAWFEPTFLIVSSVLTYGLAILLHYSWMAFVYPIPLLVFSAVLAIGIYRDRKQLLKHTKGGYRVQIGNEASNFTLPDQTEIWFHSQITEINVIYW